ncbi:hypothetical protein OF83DRAFT_1134521 [Amylostereum chailletii]|nr:hypothetical protein OF83DRAFT_1134521 [Amylostereum chailletii]
MDEVRGCRRRTMVRDESDRARGGGRDMERESRREQRKRRGGEARKRNKDENNGIAASVHQRTPAHTGQPGGRKWAQSTTYFGKQSGGRRRSSLRTSHPSGSSSSTPKRAPTTHPWPQYSAAPPLPVHTRPDSPRPPIRASLPFVRLIFTRAPHGPRPGTPDHRSPRALYKLPPALPCFLRPHSARICLQKLTRVLHVYTCHILQLQPMTSARARLTENTLFFPCDPREGGAGRGSRTFGRWASRSPSGGRDSSPASCAFV